MSQYRVTYQHRDRELTKDVTAFSEEEARAVFKHNFRGIAPTSVERIEFAQERKPAPAKSQPRRPFRRHGSDQEFRGIADGLRRFREKMAEASKG